MTNITDVAATARRLAALEAEAATIAEEVERLRGLLLDAVETGGTIEVDGQPRWRVTVRKTFDPALALGLLTAEQQQLCTVPRLDPAAVKRILPPAVYELCCKESAPHMAKVAAR